MQAFRDLRGRYSDDAAMPALARDHRDVTVLRIFQFRGGDIDDLLLHRLAFLVTRVEMIRETARLFGIACIKELNHGAGPGPWARGLCPWAKAEAGVGVNGGGQH